MPEEQKQPASFGEALSELRDQFPELENIADETEITRRNLTFSFQFIPAMKALQVAETLRTALGNVLAVLPQLENEPMAALAAVLSRLPTATVEKLWKVAAQHITVQKGDHEAVKLAGREDQALTGRGSAILMYELLGRALVVNLLPPSQSEGTDEDL